MTANGNIIGKLNPTSTSSTVGVYDTLDQYTAKRVNAWPITIKYSSITVNSSTSALSLNEGSSITVVVATEGITSATLYYSISSVGGTVDTNDFTDGVMTGSFTITSNTGTFTKTLVADGTSEAGDAFQVQIRTGSTSGPIVLTSSTITINNPVFTLSMTSATYNEGTNPQFSFSATNWNSQTLYWRSSTAVDDNTLGLTQNTFSYTAGATAGLAVYTLKNDMRTEGNETHTIAIYDSTNTYLLASTTYTAVDTSLAPTVTESSLSINEGDSVTFTVTFPGGPTSGTIYWTTTGTMTANDFTDAVLSGTASISASGSNGVATITRTARRDYITDGAKSFGLNLYRDGAATTLVYTGSTTRISVADTVQTPTITASATSINEGDPVTFTLTTTGVPDGTVFPYFMNTTVGSYFGSHDFTDALTSGNLTVTSNTASVTKTWANDGYTEGTQSYTLTIRPPVGSLLSTTTLATSPTIVVADTSSGTPVPELFGFTAFTFTNAGATGVSGPTYAQTQSSYNTATYPWLTNTAYFNVTSGIQYWTVPLGGTYRIAARGGNGSPASGATAGTTGGKGLIVTADVTLNKDEIIRILVGQEGLRDGSNGGGGGGTFVVRTPYNTTPSILVIAGGGGGRRTASSGVGIDGASYATYSGYGTSNSSNSSSTVSTITVNGPGGIAGFTNPSGVSGGVVTLGFGGAAANTGYGDGGGGFFGNGRDDTTASTSTGTAFIDASFPGRGGISSAASGGFGGGGGGAGGNGGGGGGGYTGGNGGHTAGGGGSYVIASATNVSYTTDANATGIATSGFHGYCTITKL